MSTPCAHAANESLSEYAIKAGFLYNFMKFVEWPQAAFKNDHAPITVCILGDDPFEENLEFLRNATVKGRRLAITRLAGEENPGVCNVLFVSKSEQGRFKELLRPLRKRPVLTIGEADDFCSAGGIINLFTEHERVRFKINVDAAAHAGLKISSDLLRLAVIVREGK